MNPTELLLDLLAQERATLQTLKELAGHERRSLLNTDVAEIEQITKQQTQLLSAQCKTSAKISACLQQIANDLSLGGRATLARVAEHLPHNEATRLQDHYRAISLLAEEVRREGRLNWHLSQQALKFVNFTLRMISQTDTSPVYSSVQRTRQARPVAVIMDSCA